MSGFIGFVNTATSGPKSNIKRSEDRDKKPINSTFLMIGSRIKGDIQREAILQIKWPCESSAITTFFSENPENDCLVSYIGIREIIS